MLIFSKEKIGIYYWVFIDGHYLLHLRAPLNASYRKEDLVL